MVILYELYCVYFVIYILYFIENITIWLDFFHIKFEFLYYCLSLIMDNFNFVIWLFISLNVNLYGFSFDGCIKLTEKHVSLNDNNNNSFTKEIFEILFLKFKYFLLNNDEW